MGCLSSLICVDMAKQLLKVQPNPALRAWAACPRTCVDMAKHLLKVQSTACPCVLLPLVM